MMLKTERLTLSDYMADDAAHYFQLKSCAPVWRYSTSVPLTETQSEEALAKLIVVSKQGLPVFGKLTLTETDEYVGEAGIIAHNQETARCVVGYNLLPEFWGNGYATEITRALVRYAFEELQAERVDALVQKENMASRRVLEKSGLLLEGILRHYTKIGGEYADVCFYGIISGDYFNTPSARIIDEKCKEGLKTRGIEYGSPEYGAALILRDRILRKPIGLNLFDEDLSSEANDVHLGAFDRGKLIGVLVLTRVDTESVRMRQVAVDESWQRHGVGTALVKAAEREAVSLGYSRMTLHARATATAFYERLGYAAEGQPFTEVGIPHREMSKVLTLV